MSNAKNHLPSRTSPRDPRIAARAAERSAEDADHEAGVYRSARDFPLYNFAYLDFAEEEQNAHNAAYYDAAEELDMN
jgi:hypothetical protein